MAVLPLAVRRQLCRRRRPRGFLYVQSSPFWAATIIAQHSPWSAWRGRLTPWRGAADRLGRIGRRALILISLSTLPPFPGVSWRLNLFVWGHRRPASP